MMRLTKTELKHLLHQETHVPIWKRILAFLIDMLILYGIILAPLQKLLPETFSTNFRDILSTAEALQPFEHTLLILSTIMAFITLLYFSLLEGILQQTPGKIILNLRVESTAKEFSWWQAVVRNITKALCTTSLGFLFVIDVLYLFFKKKRLSDLLSKTEVRAL